MLAINGAPPAFSEPVHVGRPNLGDRHELMARIHKILDCRWLSNNGKFVNEFESRVAALSNVNHAVAYTNATIAIEWLIRSMELQGEIIIPDFTFAATAHAVQSAGCKPVLADVDPHRHLMDPSSVEELVTSETCAIMGVHLWGLPCHVERLQEIAKQHDLPLLFDAAHSLGCYHRGRPLATFGDASVYSFHATKFVNSLEGGFIVTDDDQLAERLRLARNFGFVGYDDVVQIGTNAKMDEFRGAVGLGSLDVMDQVIRKNRSNWEAYREGLCDCAGVELVQFPDSKQSNFQYVIANVTPDCPLTRDELVNVLWTENVRARRYFYPGIHRMLPFRQCRQASSLNGSLAASDRVLVLPTGEALGRVEIAKITSIIAFATESPLAVRESLAGTTLVTHPLHSLETE